MPSNEDFPHVGDVVPTVASNPSHQFATVGDWRTRIGQHRQQRQRLLGEEVRVVDPVTGGEKGSKPERFDLIPWEALEEVARVYSFGARKYDDHNWRKGMKWSLAYAAAFRHMAKFVQGETHDPESGLHHLAHAAFHMLTLITYTMKGLGTDDRPR